MYYLDEISQDIANKYILKSAPLVTKEDYANFGGYEEPLQEIQNRIYGIAITKKGNENIIEIFCDNRVDSKIIESALEMYSRHAKIELFKTSIFRPFQLQSGSRVGHIRLQGYGTLGGFVLDGGSDKILMLSNNHVIANENNAILGDPIVDHNRNAIGSLERFIPLLLPPYRNVVDAAVGTIHGDKFYQDYSYHKYTPANPHPGMRVHKLGARTGLTHGYISSINGVALVNYNLGSINFIDCLVIRGINGQPFSQPGDSGSFIFSETKHVVGMVFAGNNDISFGNSIDAVSRYIGINF